MILTGAELSKYFGKETTPREMKDQIIKLLDDWKGQQKEHEKPEKKTEPEKEAETSGQDGAVDKPHQIFRLTDRSWTI